MSSNGEEKSGKRRRIDSGSSDRALPEPKKAEFQIEKVQVINGKPTTIKEKKAIQSLMLPGSDNFWGEVKGWQVDEKGEKTGKRKVIND